MLVLFLGFISSISCFMLICLVIIGAFDISQIHYFMLSGYYIFFCLSLLLLGFIVPINRLMLIFYKIDDSNQDIVYLLHKNNLQQKQLKIHFVTNNQKLFSIKPHNNIILVFNQKMCQMDYISLELYIKERIISLFYRLENKNYALLFVLSPIKIFYLIFRFLFIKLKQIFSLIAKIGKNHHITLSVLSILLSLFIIIFLSLLSPIIVILYIFNYITILLGKFNQKQNNNLIKNAIQVLY